MILPTHVWIFLHDMAAWAALGWEEDKTARIPAGPRYDSCMTTVARKTDACTAEGPRTKPGGAECVGCMEPAAEKARRLFSTDGPSRP